MRGAGSPGGAAFGDTDFCIAYAGQEGVEFSTALVFRCASFPALTVGVEICEDVWVADTPSTRLCAGGATLILNPSASDEIVSKAAWRRTLLSATSGRLACGYVYADAGWGESSTDLIYAGHDLILENGSLLAERRFGTGLTVSEIDLEKLEHERQRMNTFPAAAEVYPVYFELEEGETALTRYVDPNPFVPADRGDREERCAEILRLSAQGLAKRLKHTNAKTAVVGLSGGLDSTLAILITAIAYRPAGPGSQGHPGRHHALLRHHRPHPGQRLHAGRASWAPALKRVDIGEAVKVHFRDIGQSMDDHSVTFENGQARERTQVLMDLANRVWRSGHRHRRPQSELALGWATYNGDHMCMYGVNASIPKTLVRHLVAFVSDDKRSGSAEALRRAGRYSGHPRLPGAAARRGRQDRPEDRGSGRPL